MPRKQVHPAMTLHDLMADLEQSLSLTPEQKFRVAAKIKRYVHGEKYSLLMRMSHYAEYKWAKRIRKFRHRKKAMDNSLRFLTETIIDKMNSHHDWASLPDEQVITFTMGSFTYPPKKDPEPVQAAQ